MLEFVTTLSSLSFSFLPKEMNATSWVQKHLLEYGVFAFLIRTFLNFIWLPVKNILLTGINSNTYTV